MSNKTHEASIVRSIAVGFIAAAVIGIAAYCGNTFTQSSGTQNAGTTPTQTPNSKTWATTGADSKTWATTGVSAKTWATVHPLPAAETRVA